MICITSNQNTDGNNSVAAIYGFIDMDVFVACHASFRQSKIIPYRLHALDDGYEVVSALLDIAFFVPMRDDLRQSIYSEMRSCISFQLSSLCDPDINCHLTPSD